MDFSEYRHTIEHYLTRKNPKFDVSTLDLNKVFEAYISDVSPRTYISTMGISMNESMDSKFNKYLSRVISLVKKSGYTIEKMPRGKLGLTFKHSRYAAQRVDLTKEANITKVRERVAKLNFLTEEYIDQMNAYALAKVTDNDINEYVMNLFVDDRMHDLIRQNNYNYDVEEVSTRTKNLVESFNNVLHSDNMGQDFARGTKLWLFNGTTLFTSNFASYGSAKDTEAVRAEKKFNSMLNGTANKRIQKAIQLLAV